MFWLIVAVLFGVPILLGLAVQLRKRNRQAFYAETKEGDVTKEAEITPSRPVL